MKKIAIPYLIFLLIDGSAVLLAQTNWERLDGLFGGPVSALATSENGRLFAATSSGLYKSDDQGESWISVLERQCFDLLTDENKIYAVTSSNKLVYSTDNGETFITMSEIPGSYSTVKKVGSELIAFSNPYTSMQLFASLDNGITWVERYNFNHEVVGQIIISGESILIATGSYGLFRSDDAGATFFKKNEHHIVWLTKDSSNKLYWFTQESIYSSIDNGDTYSNVTYDFPFPLYGSACINANDELLIFNTLESKTLKLNQQTNHWQVMSSSFPLKNEVTHGITTTLYGLFFYTHQRGLYKLSQDGASWKDSNKNIPISFFSGLGISMDSALIVSSPIGISKFEQNTWLTTPTSSLGRILYQGKLFTFGNTSLFLTSQFFSDNNGVSWHSNNQYFSQSAKAPNNTLFSYNIEFVGSVLTPSLNISKDYGKNWTTVTIEDIPILYLNFEGIAADSDNVYMVGLNPSSNRYDLCQINLTSKIATTIYSTDQPIFSVGANQGSIYLNSNSGLRRTDDGGASWITVFIAEDPTGEIAVAPYYGFIGKSIWVGGLFGEIKYSIDKGDSWTDVSMPTSNKNIRANNFVSDRKGVVLITMNEYGVIKSDGRILNPNLLDIFNPEIITNIPETIKTNYSYYPNPAESTLIISFPKELNPLHIIAVYDINGKELLNKRTMENDVLIDIGELAPGLYFIKTNSESHGFQSSKFIKK